MEWLPLTATAREVFDQAAEENVETMEYAQDMDEGVGEPNDGGEYMNDMGACVGGSLPYYGGMTTRHPIEAASEDITNEMRRLNAEGQEFIMRGSTPARHPSSARFHEILEENGELHDQKQKDYGRGDDPFANVRASTEWGMPGWVGAMVRANDKMKRLQKFARDGTLANEGVIDSFRDLAVYAIIAQVLYEQDQG
jgi:hypothetical protein